MTRNDIGEMNSLSELFVWFKKNISETIKVSTLAFYKKTIKEYDDNDGYGIISVAPFPLKEGESEYTVNAYIFSPTTFSTEEKVLVIFTDNSFSENLKFKTPKITTNINTHKNYFGVAMSLKHGDSAGVNSIGGASGDISLGRGLKIENNKLDIDNNNVQVKLTSGENIKTINGLSILGSGNLDIGGLVTDVKINGLSIVENGIANIELGSGIKYVNNELTLSSNNLQEVNPKQLSIDNQKKLDLILIDNNGEVKKTSLNDLDYTKLKVVDSENLSSINTGDFLFVKER